MQSVNPIYFKIIYLLLTVQLEHLNDKLCQKI